MAGGNDKVEAPRKTWLGGGVQRLIGGCREVGMNQIMLCFVDQTICFNLCLLVMGSHSCWRQEGLH